MQFPCENFMVFMETDTITKQISDKANVNQ